MQNQKLRIALLIALSSAALLNGCGSSNKEGSAALNDVATVGDTACIQCHGGRNLDVVTGEDIVAQYRQSSPHNKDGLGCEACHGGGAQHNGVGPIPYAAPDVARCEKCHDGTTAPATSAAKYATSAHTADPGSHGSGICVRCHTNEGALLGNKSGITGENANNVYSNNIGKISWAYGTTAINCSTCHEHGGGLRSIMAVYSTARGTGTGTALWNPSKASGTSPVNNQFNLCTSCHNMFDYTGNKVIASGTTASGSRPYYHATSWYRVIATTHKEKSMTFGNMSSLPDPVSGAFVPRQNSNITGYVVRMTKPSTGATTVSGINYSTDPYYNGPCFDCHGHEAKTNTASTRAGRTPEPTIYTDWAMSGHGGEILTAKVAAAGTSSNTAALVDTVMQAGSSDKVVNGATVANGWGHYNWDSTFNAAGASDRGSCQVCHTSTGISNYLNNAATYDATKNNFSHLTGWNQKGGSKQNEVLYCWGCHKDAGTGALRNTASATLTFTYNSQPIVITGAGNSSACIVCHGGRGNIESTRSSRFQGHHAPTAGILYSAQTHMGYEYAGKDYANPSYFAHDKIGLNASGPCASCHMGSKSHTFHAVTEDTAGAITAISNQALCNTCHTVGGAYEMTPAKLEAEKEGYKEASTILNNYVSNLTGYTNYLNLAIGSSNYNNTSLVENNAYGAYQNAKLYGDEPCGYVHNRYYVKRLIFDSIDWMDNGVLNGTITVDATAYPEAAAWLGATSGTATRP